MSPSGYMVSFPRLKITLSGNTKATYPAKPANGPSRHPMSGSGNPHRANSENIMTGASTLIITTPNPALPWVNTSSYMIEHHDGGPPGLHLARSTRRFLRHPSSSSSSPSCLLTRRTPEPISSAPWRSTNAPDRPASRSWTIPSTAMYVWLLSPFDAGTGQVASRSVG